ncbi:PREDICTED: calmin [Chrysochloris asiatica]|uniref:Calmin n=1 Tax=Chrysochloris asiatica TaxID=185453 RepID=A0A9B0WI84_CHRAS|nr:PREDICTED: calmin [Chrysochloris asiatica]
MDEKVAQGLVTEDFVCQQTLKGKEAMSICYVRSATSESRTSKVRSPASPGGSLSGSERVRARPPPPGPRAPRPDRTYASSEGRSPRRVWRSSVRGGPGQGGERKRDYVCEGVLEYLLPRSIRDDEAGDRKGAVPSANVERENVQKRTFTRWINLHLEKCDPPLEVKDLFVDIQDGKILMALLEVLSGRNLLHEYKSSSHRIFRLNNIAKALKFLEDSNVKLVSIDAAEIADGNPSLVLGLIWNIILFFQIKELTGNLSRNSPSSSLSPGSGGTDSDSSFPPTPTTERSAALSLKDQRKAIKTLLAWVQKKTRKYGVAVQDFAGSWRSGLAFLAVIKAIDPSLVDMKQALEDSTRDNLEKAFSIAHDALNIPRLLEPEDIMVDVPDEQSIVTYVAQFLERFPELETEDFVDSDKEFPIESTFVRIIETPSDQESTIFLLTENGERAYTVNHEASHPPPSKVFVCDKAESAKGFQLQPHLDSASGSLLPDSSQELIHQLIGQVLQGVPCKANNVCEPAPETSILASRNRRTNSLPVKKTVHFEADVGQDASCSKGLLYNQGVAFEGSPRGAKEASKQDGPKVAVEVEEGKKPNQEAPKTPETAFTKDDVSLAAGKLSDSQSSHGSSACNGALEGSTEQVLASTENTVVADSLEIKVKLLRVEALDNQDYFECIPLKASKFNSDLVDFASTSHAFSEAPSLPENKPASNDSPQDHDERSGKRSSKSANKKQESPKPWAESDQSRLHGDAFQGYSLTSEEIPAAKKPEVYEKAKRKSTRLGDEDEGDLEEFQGGDGELPSNPPSSSVSLETLRGNSEEGLDFKPSPPLSKVSIIPHELFYYPHYQVPLAAVLEAYTEDTEDLKIEEDADLDDPENSLQDLDGREEEEAEDSQGSCSSGVMGQDLPSASEQELNLDWAAEDTHPAPEPNPPSQPEESTPGDSNQSQESTNSENIANSREENMTEEPISSKKKEKRKHMDHVESSIFIAPGTVRSSDDLEEDMADHKIPSRTSYSDSSIYIRRHTNRSLESDHFSYVQLRNAADLDSRRNRTLTSKVNNSGEAMLPDSHSPPSGSLTEMVQQPDTIYFILFLWLLAYCLLLIPQLDFNRL